MPRMEHWVPVCSEELESLEAKNDIMSRRPLPPPLLSPSHVSHSFSHLPMLSFGRHTVSVQQQKLLSPTSAGGGLRSPTNAKYALSLALAACCMCLVFGSASQGCSAFAHYTAHAHVGNPCGSKSRLDIHAAVSCGPEQACGSALLRQGDSWPGAGGQQRQTGPSNMDPRCTSRRYSRHWRQSKAPATIFHHGTWHSVRRGCVREGSAPSWRLASSFSFAWWCQGLATRRYLHLLLSPHGILGNTQLVRPVCTHSLTSPQM
jgi:hypothetical protein